MPARSSANKRQREQTRKERQAEKFLRRQERRGQRGLGGAEQPLAGERSDAEGSGLSSESPTAKSPETT